MLIVRNIEDGQRWTDWSAHWEAKDLKEDMGTSFKIGVGEGEGNDLSDVVKGKVKVVGVVGLFEEGWGAGFGFFALGDGNVIGFVEGAIEVEDKGEAV